jgi:hypothetical protein
VGWAFAHPGRHDGGCLFSPLPHRSSPSWRHACTGSARPNAKAPACACRCLNADGFESSTKGAGNRADDCARRRAQSLAHSCAGIFNVARGRRTYAGGCLCVCAHTHLCSHMFVCMPARAHEWRKLFAHTRTRARARACTHTQNTKHKIQNTKHTHTHKTHSLSLTHWFRS